MKTRVRNWVIGGVGGGVLASAFAHAGTFAGLSYALARRAPPVIVAELDLSMAAMLPPNPGGGRAAAPAPVWTAPKHGLPPAPAPVEAALLPAAPEESTPCPEPCTASAIGTGGGGTGESEGRYIPASQAARQPRWISNFITTKDYPQSARQRGKDGRVVLSVLIDASGVVRDARLLQGADEALNELALRKIRQAVFSPAYDADDNPVACQVKMPIRFSLEDE